MSEFLLPIENILPPAWKIAIHDLINNNPDGPKIENLYYSGQSCLIIYCVKKFSLEAGEYVVAEALMEDDNTVSAWVCFDYPDLETALKAFDANKLEIPKPN